MAFSSGLRAFLAQRPIMSLFSASALSYACYSLFSSSKSSTSPFQSLLSILSSRPSFDAVTIPASHSSPSASSTTGVVDTHFHSSDGPVQLFTMKKSAPQQSPDWLLELFANPQFELIDLRRHLDPAYHLLYGSLHKKHGIETYYLFVEKRPSDFSTAESVSSSASSSFASSSASISDDSLSSSSSSSSSFAPHVYAVFRVGPALCGHRNIIHGGLTAALIDDISGAAVVSAFGSGQFTVNLQVNYLSPIPADSFVLVRGQAWKQEGRKTSVRVTVEDGQGKKYAEGTALYVKPKEGVHKVIEKARRELKDNDLTPSEVDAKKLINQTV